jgi:hypothetical protein
MSDKDQSRETVEGAAASPSEVQSLDVALPLADARLAGILEIPVTLAPEEKEASEILQHLERELSSVEERTDRLMYHYGI